MTDLTHLDLLKKLDELEAVNRNDHLILMKEISEMKLELHTTVKVNCQKLETHEKELVHAFDDIHKLEDRTWRAGGAVLVGAIALIGSIGTLLFTVISGS